MKGLSDLPRAVRRSVFAIEDRARRTGAWGDWQQIDVRGRSPGNDWMREVHTVFKTDWLVVMVRTADTAWGPVEHAIIRTARNAELGWAEKQRIKNDLFGFDRLAVEVMPAADRVVDAADIYHLWVLPAGFVMPFGIHRLDALPTPTPSDPPARWAGDAGGR